MVTRSPSRSDYPVQLQSVIQRALGLPEISAMEGGRNVNQLLNIHRGPSMTNGEKLP